MTDKAVNTFKVVSGSTNVLLIINGKGVPAQVTSPTDKDANEHYRFLLRDDKLSVYFPRIAQLEQLCGYLLDCAMQQIHPNDHYMPLHDKMVELGLLDGNQYSAELKDKF